MRQIYIYLCLMAFCCGTTLYAQPEYSSGIRGTIKNEKKEAVAYASVFLKNTDIRTSSDEKGIFNLTAPAGEHILCVRMMGYAVYEEVIMVKAGESPALAILLQDESFQIAEAVVSAKSVVQRVNESAFNVIAIDTKALHNSTLDMANAMSKVSGVKIRESGGLGSDLQFSLNGFSGRHVKFFMDGVPMEGMGASFQINNIPINMAERIEVYKGVVPVGFGSDAIGGAVNIVTNQRRKSFVDASYSYGSFNTHRSSLSAGHTTAFGFIFELTAFRNYSDNAYKIDNAVKDLESGQIDTDKIETVKRFNDTYHNETLIAKVGLVNKKFADRLVFGINVGKNYKEIQNGVRQDVVFGQKHSKGQTLMPSFVYSKRDIFTKGLNLNLTANYSKNIRQSIDTATYAYNWRGESIYNNGKRGEQSYQDSKYENRNWNATLTSTYRVNDRHSFTLNDVLTSYDRNTRATANDAAVSATDTMPKISQKNVLGLSYKYNKDAKWNFSLFGKHYLQYSKGPKNVSTDTGHPKYEILSETFTDFGYGAAGTFFWKDFQGKLSFEKAIRLPTDNELFGDQDMERGSTGLKAENSDNYNLSLSYEKHIRRVHFIFVDIGFALRNTKDYIRRVTDSYSGLYYASHINHGYVRNVGFNAELRYNYKDLIALGANITSQNIRDNEKETMGTSASTTYKARIPNIPYFFANGDLAFFLNNFLRKGNKLSFTYNCIYVHAFPLYSEKHGAAGKILVPTQLSHDAGLTYTLKDGRYNLALECKNLSNEKMYDNFSLQKPGRALCLKLRYFFSK